MSRHIKIAILAIVMLVIGFVLGGRGAVDNSNLAFMLYNKDTIQERVNVCRNEGKEYCHAEYIYDGDFIVDYNIVGYNN